jgi:tetratricopeptide (TPR) repeat protein
MGGSTALGVAEAVRVLVSSGDIVPAESGFRWRRGPTARAQAVSVEALIEERVEELDDDMRRVLEILAWVPDPGERALVSDVAAVDGLALPALERAIEELSLKAFIESRGSDVWLSHTVRRVVLEGMSPARGPDLSLRVAGALSRLCGERSLFARADVAFYLARGGRPQSAVDTLLEAAMAAAQHGFVRSGVRLAAAAVECNPSVETRRKAATIAEGLGRSVVAPVMTSALGQQAKQEERISLEMPQLSPEKLAEQAVQQALRAIRNRDFDSVDRALELMVAAGRDGAHVDRIRGLSRLEKGDRSGAIQLFAKARSRERSQDSARARLTRALVAYHDNELPVAVREALAALAIARAQSDILGEAATLKALAAFYQALGRATEAQELAALAGRSQLPERAVSGSSAT